MADQKNIDPKAAQRLLKALEQKEKRKPNQGDKKNKVTVKKMKGS